MAININKYINHLALGILGIGLSLAVIANLFYPQKISIFLLLLVLLLMSWCLWTLLSQWLNSRTEKQLHWFFRIGMGLILLIQLFILVFLPATIHHDPFRVLYQAEQLSYGRYDWGATTYFWRYPNNVPLTYLISLWLRLTHSLNLSTNIGIAMLSLLMLDTFIVTVLVFVDHHTQQNGFKIMLLLFFLLSPFAYTYYLQVFYSDLPLLLGLLWLFIITFNWTDYSRRHKAAFGNMLVLITVLAALIKPNFVLIGIAAVIVLGLYSVDHQQSLQTLLPLFLILLGLLLSLPAKSFILQIVHFSNHSSYEIPLTNWIAMSYAPSGNGSYHAAAIQKMNTLPTLKARQTYLNQQLPHILALLGPTGILLRWFKKALTFFSVNTVFSSYTGGYRSAPRFFQPYIRSCHAYGQISARFFLIELDLLGLTAAFQKLRHKDSRFSWQESLVVITMVGFFLFHTLVWESEARYGQVFLPMLFIWLATSKQKIILPKLEQTQISGIALVLSTFVLLGAAGLHSATAKTPKLVVAAQLSQLSIQYHAKPWQLPAGQKLLQTVALNHQADHVTLYTPVNAKLTGILKNIHTGRSYPLTRKQDRMTLHHSLPIGTYQLMLTNQTHVEQPVMVSHTENNQLAASPLKFIHTSYKNASLVYFITT
ncbi:hypothetical protein IV38_GL001534 [Lactobacillus selangorensis]|uniref:Glycosyltransferase RgtA/B/C/D-like domain-containing protein n=1 Tax=Lactobacillus selangorensis TaxID=81857 RepID=A0A0R2FTL7_9LACO|nr:hypothetical protein [Lactobacillus selangorensis]KRN28084.1 hypothetical protein IV38_GL001534 [Lactobacillus selangorensis]KRN31038.1 hypothetical protein IV40_GL001681 [Lactobacillus selangorensis]